MMGPFLLLFAVETVLSDVVLIRLDLLAAQVVGKVVPELAV